MPDYIVRVTHTYPVSAVDPKDALSTVPIAIRMKYINVHAEGLTEILDALTKEVVLRAQLNPALNRKVVSGGDRCLKCVI